jgi:hypothetical protein
MTQLCLPEKTSHHMAAMLRLPQRVLQMGHLLLAGCIAIAAGPVLLASDPPPFSAAQLRELVAQSLKSGWIKSDPAKNRIEGDTLLVKDAGVVDRMDADAENPYVHVFYDQVEIELRRQQLFTRRSSRQAMEPYFSKMDDLVAKKLAVVQDSKLNDEARADKLDKLDEQLNKTYEDGLLAVAKSLGLKKSEFIAEGAAPAHDVRLVASRGATIDIVRRTTAVLLKDVGKSEDDFPWTSYQANDTAPLIGAYYCRIRLRGKQAAFTKKVAENTERLDFPDP